MKKVIIIGGGFAGSYIAKNLEKSSEVTLIDNKDYFEFTPGILRTIVDPEHIKKIQAFHNDYLKKAKVLIGQVKEINDKCVIINKEKIEFDYLVICSGSSYYLPIKEKNIVIAARANHIGSYYNKIKDAKKITIVGGGLVGVELSAEIVTNYKNKEVVLIDDKSKVMERTPEKASAYAEKFLRKNKVILVYNEQVIEYTPVIITDKGKRIEADLVFLCTGIIPNSDFLEKNFKNILNENKYVMVNEHLQVLNYSNIFAAGDVNNTEVEKTAQNAIQQAKIIISNIRALEKNKVLKKYAQRKTPLVISLGKWDGVFIFHDIVVHGFIPGLMKTIIEKWEMKVMYRKRKKY